MRVSIGSRLPLLVLALGLMGQGAPPGPQSIELIRDFDDTPIEATEDEWSLLEAYTWRGGQYLFVHSTEYPFELRILGRTNASAVWGTLARIPSYEPHEIYALSSGFLLRLADSISATDLLVYRWAPGEALSWAGYSPRTHSPAVLDDQLVLSIRDQVTNAIDLRGADGSTRTPALLHPNVPDSPPPKVVGYTHEGLLLAIDDGVTGLLLTDAQPTGTGVIANTEDLRVIGPLHVGPPASRVFFWTESGLFETDGTASGTRPVSMNGVSISSVQVGERLLSITTEGVFEHVAGQSLQSWPAGSVAEARGLEVFLGHLLVSRTATTADRILSLLDIESGAVRWEATFPAGAGVPLPLGQRREDAVLFTREAPNFSQPQWSELTIQGIWTELDEGPRPPRGRAFQLDGEWYAGASNEVQRLGRSTVPRVTELILAPARTAYTNFEPVPGVREQHAVFRVFTASGVDVWSTDGTPAGSVRRIPNLPVTSELVHSRTHLFEARSSVREYVWLATRIGAGGARRELRRAPYLGSLAADRDQAFVLSHDPDFGSSVWASHGLSTDGAPLAAAANPRIWSRQLRVGNALYLSETDADFSSNPTTKRLDLSDGRLDDVPGVDLIAREFLCANETADAVLLVSRGLDPAPLLRLDLIDHSVTTLTGPLFHSEAVCLGAASAGLVFFGRSYDPASTQSQFGVFVASDDEVSELVPQSGFPSRSRPIGPTALEGRVLFAHEEFSTGTELWISDGTNEGTELLVDLWPGPSSAAPTALVRASDRVYFYATEPREGREVYVSDGTAEGTHIYGVMEPGPVGLDDWQSRPHLIATQTHLILEVARIDVGHELFSLALPTQLVPDAGPEDTYDATSAEDAAAGLDAPDEEDGSEPDAGGWFDGSPAPDLGRPELPTGAEAACGCRATASVPGAAPWFWFLALVAIARRRASRSMGMVGSASPRLLEGRGSKRCSGSSSSTSMSR